MVTAIAALADLSDILLSTTRKISSFALQEASYTCISCYHVLGIKVSMRLRIE